MDKQLSVLVAGIPIQGVPVEEWRKRVTFKVAGRTPKTPKSRLAESFVPGCTNWLRKPVVRRLQESGRLAGLGVVVQVQDAGELVGGAVAGDKGGVKEDELLELAAEFAQMCKDVDLALLFGGDHTGGLLLYSLGGQVARFDEHSDSCAKPMDCSTGFVQRNNYVCSAIHCGLKKPAEIVGVGVREGESPYPLAPFAKNASVLDVDVDVLADAFGFKTDYSKGRLSPDDLVGAVRSNSPSALGFFEAVAGDPKAVAFACTLAEEAAVAAAKKLRRIRR